jgi:hypothetical protein
MKLGPVDAESGKAFTTLDEASGRSVHGPASKFEFGCSTCVTSKPYENLDAVGLGQLPS